MFKNIRDFFIVSKNNNYPVENHVVVTNSSSGDTMIHIWKGDHLDNSNSLKLSGDQAIKLRDALINRFGV